MLRPYAIELALPAMLHKAAKAGRTEAYAKLEAQHNPTDFEGNKQIDFTGKTVDRDQQIYDTIDGAMSRKN